MQRASGLLLIKPTPKPERERMVSLVYPYDTSWYYAPSYHSRSARLVPSGRCVVVAKVSERPAILQPFANLDRPDAAELSFKAQKFSREAEP